MKIAFTADNHLTKYDQHPERFISFADILKKSIDNGADLLVLAGDVFDRESHNYVDFESIYSENSLDTLKTIVIPGNHDQGLNNKSIALDNFEVIEEATLLNLEHEMSMLLVPYNGEKTMGEDIGRFAEKLDPFQWLLVGHGDWSEGVRSPDPYEQGVYMPLTRSDITRYRPLKAVLGHIHLPFDGDVVHYPGSPCPLQINETGLRRFILFDTGTRQVEHHLVDSPVIFFNETFVVLPVEDEEKYLKDKIDQRIKTWGLPDGWAERVTVRVIIKGFASDRSAIRKIVKTSFKPFKFYKDNGLNMNELNISADMNRAHLARQVKTWIDLLDWNKGNPDPTKDDILIEALKAIYGV